MFAEFVVVVVRKRPGADGRGGGFRGSCFQLMKGKWLGVRVRRDAKGTGDCSTIILISCAERLHARLIASRGIFNKYFIRRGIITA